LDLHFGGNPDEAYCVFYEQESPTTLERITLPDNPSTIYQPSRGVLTTEMTLPDYSPYDPTTFTRLHLTEPLTDEEKQAYQIIQAQLTWTAGIIYHLPCHRLLGHPDVVQWDMYQELGGEASDWTLLLQIDSDDVPHTKWGDIGRIYFWILTQDLQQRDFSRVRLLLQC
jgi:uncharacterized protein YwqG